MAKTSNIVYGLRPVIEAIRAGQHIDRILLQNGLSGSLFGELKALIRQHDIPFQHVPVEKLSKMTEGNHQGVVATIAPVSYHSFVEVVERLQEEERVPLILLLDHVTDVRNMGAIARTAECAGVDALVVPDHGSAQINEDAVKTSSGALLRLPVCRESNLKTVLNLARQYGMQICAATEKGSDEYTAVDFTQPTLLIMGAEETGVGPELLKLCDKRAVIPICGEVQSLNVSVAAGVMMYEALRQRRQQ
ncbi:MAG: 23S rRNA (guanosine(2251)-2'-O)-methyltransferase RlmB [Bacteroidales bacterium]|nr:23S rRNA (guanosine(2251)-2'-O)-methyltransferase RlmB [Bacteroidales bacterium]